MQGKSVCKKCCVTFDWNRSSKRKPPMFCSMKCRGHTGFTAGFQGYRIDDLSEDEKAEMLRQSYEKHVVRQEGCWNWRGPKRKFGYGAMTCSSKFGASDAHRASWILSFGQIPDDLFVCHKCDNPICSNPDHLFLGTPQDNVQDMRDKGRQKYTTPPVHLGEKNPQSILSTKQVAEIKKLLSNGVRQVDIARSFSVSRQVIYRINAGKTWAHVKEQESCKA